MRIERGLKRARTRQVSNMRTSRGGEKGTKILERSYTTVPRKKPGKVGGQAKFTHGD